MIFGSLEGGAMVHLDSHGSPVLSGDRPKFCLGGSSSFLSGVSVQSPGKLEKRSFAAIKNPSMWQDNSVRRGYAEFICKTEERRGEDHLSRGGVQVEMHRLSE